MNNGQLNIASQSALTPLVAQELNLPVTAAIDAEQQAAGGFAGLLSGIQLLGKAKVPCDVRQAAQHQVIIDADRLAGDSGTDQQVVDLPVMFKAAQINIPAPDPAAQKSGAPEKSGPGVDVIPGGESSGIALQVALAAYSQSGRMPEVNIPTPLHVDRLQNVTGISEQSAVVSTPQIENPAERVTAESLPKSPVQATGEEIKTPSTPFAEGHAKPLYVTSNVQANTLQSAKSDRMSDVNELKPPPADKLQKVAATTGKRAVFTAPAVKNHPESAVVEPAQSAQKSETELVERQITGSAVGLDQHKPPETVRSTVVDRQPATVVAPPLLSATPVQPEAKLSTPKVNIPTSIPVDKLQNAAAVSEQPVVVTVSAVKNQPDQVTAEPSEAAKNPAAVLVKEPAADPAADQNQHNKPEEVRTAAIYRPPGTAATEQAASAAPPAAVQQATAPAQPEATHPAPEVNIPTPSSVDRPKNTAIATERTAVTDAPADISKLRHVATEPAQTSPAQNSIRPAEKNAAVPAQTEYFVPNGAKAADIPPVPAEKLTAEATTSTAFQSERPAAWPIAAAPVSTPESEIEIQISQPQPITARVIAAPVLSDNHPATLIQEARGSRQPLSREQQVEKAGTGNDQVVVKEMAPSLRIVASIGESMAGSDTSQNSDSDQGQPDGFSDNQLLAQDMRGQWRADHQKVGGNAARTVSTESVRQDIPEQVMQQVKERLVQHDVKPGNQQITLTLSPDSLGELKMNLNLQGQKLSVEIITENRTARDAIVQHTDALKESLARQNITMESFDVTTGGKGSGNQGQNQNAWRELTRQQQQQQFWTSPRGYQTAQADLPSGQAAYLRQQGHSMLDIHY